VDKFYPRSGAVSPARTWRRGWPAPRRMPKKEAAVAGGFV